MSRMGKDGEKYCGPTRLDAEHWCEKLVLLVLSPTLISCLSLKSTHQVQVPSEPLFLWLGSYPPDQASGDLPFAPVG